MKEIPLAESDFKELAMMVRGIALFQNLSMGDLERVLSVTRLYEAKRGEVIFRKGDVGDGLYVIKGGSVDVCRYRFAWIPGSRLAQLHEGQFFGEMALLDQPYRTATALATQPSQLFVILATRFNDLLRANPEMALRLRQVAAQRQFDQRHT